MIKRIIALFCAVVLITTCFASCKKEDTTNKFFAYGITEMPKHFDPQIAESVSEKMIAVNTFDGLFKLDENNTPVKCAVKDYKISTDGLVYTFYLRDDMQYYISGDVEDFLEEKGTTISKNVTAKDFAFGIIRALLPETDAPDFELLSAIKNAAKIHKGELNSSAAGVKVINDYTLEITLDRKDVNFLYALTQPISFPCNQQFFELTAGRYGLDEEYIISNGGFYLSSISEDKNVVINKNTEYNGAFSPLPSGVGFYLNATTFDIAKKVDDGTYDVGFFYEDDDKDELDRSVVKTELKNIACSLVFNMADKTIQNNALRTGLVSCVDISLISENPLKSVLPSYYGVNNSKVEALSYNIDTARNSMLKAFDELKIKTLDIEIICTQEYENTAKALVNNWQKNIGVELNGIVTVLEEADFNKRVASDDFQVAICSLTVDSNNPSEFLSMFTTDNEMNISNYSSDEFNRLVNDLKSEPTNEKVVYCQSYLLKNAVVLPLYEETTTYAVHKDASGIYFSGDSSNMYFYKAQK
ncbi:MAG: peptide ABC transporter substrate-binding protein [Clostridia bacterium]|nr:peptide ABC transporter substrate-binding protein [Clostridia bacterium]